MFHLLYACKVEMKIFFNISSKVLFCLFLFWGISFAKNDEREQWFRPTLYEKINYYYTNNLIDLEDDLEKPENYMKFTTAIGAQIKPTTLEKLSFEFRMLNENKVYFHPRKSYNADEVIFDKFYMDISHIMDTPLSLRVGRQYLLYGEGFVIFDGTPGDSVRTGYYNAVKGSLDLEKSQLDTFVIYQPRKDKFIKINNQKRILNNTNTKPIVFAQGVYFINKSLEKHQIDSYYIYKREYDTPNKINVHTIGVRPAGKFNENLDYALEVALQFGKYGPDAKSIQAEGLDAHMGYCFPVKFKPTITLGYTYLSGDDPDTDKFEGWDPVLMGWSKWSELYTVTLIKEGGANQWSNMHIPRIEAKLQLTKNQSLLFGYSYLLADTRPYQNRSGFGKGKERGHLSKGIYKVTFNKNLRGHLWLEYFSAGDYYASGTDPAWFFRTELVFDF